MKTEQIEKLLGRCDGTAKSIQETANRILMEEIEFKVGDTVAVVDDESSTVSGMIGKAKIRALEADKGWASVEWPDGRTTQVMTNLLYQTPG